MGRWTWGLTELLTAVTQSLTVVGLFIAGCGLRTFGKWQREKIQERRIEVALEALALAYESKVIFGEIRSPVRYLGEGAGAPHKPGESDEQRKHRESFFAVLERIKARHDYFARLWKLQPKFIAVFEEEESEKIFDQLHSARRDIETAASTLISGEMSLDPSEPYYDKEELRRYRTDLFGSRDRGRPDPVGDKLDSFRKQIDALCRREVGRAYGSTGKGRWQFWKQGCRASAEPASGGEHFPSREGQHPGR
jgi:hypothetical protein